MCDDAFASDVVDSVVIGGGISGLAAAFELAGRIDPASVLVLEASDRVGGKLRTEVLETGSGPLRVDVGAEAMLAAHPAGLGLAIESGLGERLVHPRALGAGILHRGRLVPVPTGTVMGVPGRAADLTGLLEPDELAVMARSIGRGVRPVEPEGDVAIGALVDEQFGPAVTDRLVEPLLAGVYAGSARELSLRATVPTLWPAAASGIALRDAVTELQERGRVASTAAVEASARRSAVFAGYAGGMGSLATDLADRLRERGVRIETGVTVRELVAREAGGEPGRRSQERFEIVCGPTTQPRRIRARRVVVAVPAPATARLLRTLVPEAASVLAGVEVASMAIVTLVLPRAGLADRLTGTGALVPPGEGLTIKATTFSSNKWHWVDALDADHVVLRASIGRAGEVADLQRDDAELVESSLRDLAVVAGGPVPRPVAAQVQRWGGALPQYAVGHLAAMARVEQAACAVPGLGLAGAVYAGVGIPACIARARAEAARLCPTDEAAPIDTTPSDTTPVSSGGPGLQAAPHTPDPSRDSKETT